MTSQRTATRRPVSLADLDPGESGWCCVELEAIGRVCVYAILATPCVRFLDAWRVTDIVGSRVAKACRSDRFDFAPILEALLEVDGVTEQDLYVGILNIRVCLAAMGIQMEEPKLSLDDEERRNIVTTARAASHSARAAFELRRLRAAISRVERARLGEMLVNGHFITREQLDHALEAQKLHGRRLGTNLVEMGYLHASSLAHFLSEQLEIPCVTFIGGVRQAVIDAVPERLVKKYRVFPLELEENGSLTLAMEDPLDLKAIAEIVRYTGRVVHPVVVPESVLVYAIARHYGQLQPSRVRDA